MGPTFAEIDFGFDNNDDANYRAFYHTTRESVRVARTLFSFPGNDGVWVQRHGKRGRQIRWVVELLYVSAEIRIAWERTVESYQDDRTYPMVLNGRTYEDVQLLDMHEVQPPEGCSLPFVGRSFYVLEFLQLTA